MAIAVKTWLMVLCCALMAAFSDSALALKNPAAVYCAALGHEYATETTEAGDVGYCVFGDDQKVDAWQFLLGKVATDRSYCATKGYEQRVVKARSDDDPCLRYMTDTCSVCVLDDGTEVEVIQLMGLVLEETTCGDGVCGIPENYSSCPSDCPSGSNDAYCDKVKDGRCDPDCTPEEDLDCPKKDTKEESN